MSMWVVKIGGSLVHSAQLPQWLDLISTVGAGKVVIVPGGGPWADEVREAQKREGFDDCIAHRKALRAMERFGQLLHQLQPDLVPVACVAEIHSALRDGNVALWMPYEMVLGESSIAESWDVTSDSLAAWIARRLNATALLLVKSVRIDGPQPELGELVRRGWVDGAFAEYVSGLHFRIFGKDDQQAAQRMLYAG
jgi:5-(aminomethyl)-3-furanmethanol phosphate kinase